MTMETNDLQLSVTPSSPRVTVGQPIVATVKVVSPALVCGRSPFMTPLL